MTMAEQITRVLLIRHATNDWITSGKLPCRTAGVHLNDRGRSEAEALAERVATLPIQAIYSSPLERAMETAQAVATRLNLPVQIAEGVLETDCGEWQGQVIEELAKTDLWRTVQIYPSGFRFPGGETFGDIQARMVSAIDSLRAAHPGQLIAIFSHADPIKTAIAYYAGIPLDLFQRITISPAAISEFAFSAHGSRLLRINDGAHLPPEPEKPAEGAEAARDEGGPQGEETSNSQNLTEAAAETGSNGEPANEGEPQVDVRPATDGQREASDQASVA
jgi:probable phosphomutase (TIGR03848 family)